MTITRWADHLLGPDTEANKPDPATVPDGCLYQNSDTGVLEIQRGDAWVDYRDAAASGTLADLTDVDLTGAADGDTLVYDSTSGLWLPGAGGGGGGGGSSYQPGSYDLPPASPNVKDDEFDGTSSVVWANGPNTPTTWNINGTRPSHAVLGMTGNGYFTKYQPVPAAYPYTITAKMTSSNVGIGATNYCGIALTAAGATTGSPLVICGTVSNNSVGMMFEPSNHTTGGWSTSASGVGTGFIPLGMPVYFRFVVHSATSVDCKVSADGYTWYTSVLALNPGFTPGLMGPVVNGVGAAQTAMYDFFRVT